MKHLSEFMAAPLKLLSAGTPLPINLYVYLPQNRSILFFRRKGDLLTEEDFEKIRAFLPGHLLMPRAEKGGLQEAASHRIAEELQSGNLAGPAVQAAAAGMLQGLSPQTLEVDSSSKQLAKEMLAELPQFIEKVLSQAGKTPSVREYNETLRKIREKKGERASDPILEHNEQVSALAVLIALTLECDSSDELANLGAAGLVHDLGLRSIPMPIAQKHLIGDEELTVSEKIIYMRHVELSLEAVNSYRLSEATRAIIELHHENWDGSGFRAVKGEFVSRSVRILRIADDIVGVMNHPTAGYGFREALGVLNQRERILNARLYDEEIIEALDTLLQQEEPGSSS